MVARCEHLANALMILSPSSCLAYPVTHMVSLTWCHLISRGKAMGSTFDRMPGQTSKSLTKV